MMKSKVPANEHPLGKASIGMLAVTLAAAAIVYTMGTAKAEEALIIPPPSPAVTAGLAAGTAIQETAVFAGGCFWGIQGVFQHTKGVANAVSGYAGGSKENADYDRVSSGTTGHAESVQVTYDPQQISYGKLLQIYFSVAHDPTQLNRQYPDSGTQYRSAIFYKNANQKQIAERYIAQLEGTHLYKAKIVTQLSPLSAFYAAEKYHQDYATLHPESGYIARFDLPKIANLKKLYPDVYRETPVLVAAQAGNMAKAR
ncbi:peptide methionine sulfoxide reductase MsrA [Undibacterium terreum]|uniref:Peptide methionine sulfoxide reductase MsrA n=2 Tax=Undibacterium terreum TaxID=1224302 RepID=A0A916U7E3_9BURK|nr:peptide methionine sulfoxide reductase MsrA [Undibacterium terreum]